MSLRRSSSLLVVFLNWRNQVRHGTAGKLGEPSCNKMPHLF